MKATSYFFGVERSSEYFMILQHNEGETTIFMKITYHLRGYPSATFEENAFAAITQTSSFK